MKTENLKESIDFLKIIVRLYKQKSIDLVNSTIIFYVEESELSIVEKEYEHKVKTVNSIINKLQEIKLGKSQNFNDAECSMIFSSISFYKINNDHKINSLNETKANMSVPKEKILKEYDYEISSINELLKYLKIN